VFAPQGYYLLSITYYLGQDRFKLETAELLKRVRRLEIKTRALTNNIFAGEYHSAFKGRGMSFAEVREYQVGDDVRDIDWNVTARMAKPYVKVFEEERELTLMLLVDLSASSRFGTQERTQRELAAEVAATLAFSALQNNDKVGVIFFTDRVEKFIPPQKGRKHILYIMRELLNFEPVGKRTDVATAVEYLMHVQRKRSIVFVLSDFLDTRDFSRPLLVAARKHDLVGIRLYDRRMRELPSVGLIKIADPETGHAQYIDTSSPATLRQQRQWWGRETERLAQIFRHGGVDYTSVATHDDYVRPLMNLFAGR